MNRNRFIVEPVTWAVAESQLRHIRETVFMQEQNVPEDLEWDGKDEAAIHLLALDGENTPIGCARILQDGHIGRMAVMQRWRGRGVGRVLLRRALDIVREQGCSEAFLDAQTHALSFYEREGFVTVGEEFMDAGIPHRHMRCTL